MLVQRSEEYNAFMVAKMRAAIAEHFRQQQLAAAQEGQLAEPGGAPGDGEHQRQQRQHSEGGALARHTSLGAGDGKGGGSASAAGGLPPELAAQAAAAAAAAEAKFRCGAAPRRVLYRSSPTPAAAPRAAHAAHWPRHRACIPLRADLTAHPRMACASPPSPGAARSTCVFASWWATTWRWRSTTWRQPLRWPYASTRRCAHRPGSGGKGCAPAEPAIHQRRAAGAPSQEAAPHRAAPAPRQAPDRPHA